MLVHPFVRWWLYWLLSDDPFCLVVPGTVTEIISYSNCEEADFLVFCNNWTLSGLTGDWRGLVWDCERFSLFWCFGAGFLLEFMFVVPWTCQQRALQHWETLVTLPAWVPSCIHELNHLIYEITSNSWFHQPGSEMQAVHQEIQHFESVCSGKGEASGTWLYLSLRNTSRKASDWLKIWKRWRVWSPELRWWSTLQSWEWDSLRLVFLNRPTQILTW